MQLSNELISQLVKVTNDRQKSNGDTVVYGTIKDDGVRKYVELDGSDVRTPVETTVEINSGDRVTVSVRNHTATVTGNISDPAIGTKTADGLRSSISQTADQIRMELSNEMTQMESKLTLTAEEIRSELSSEVDGLNSRITQNANSITSLIQSDAQFSKFQQTVEGFEFMGAGGTVKISGGNINLTGSIKFSDFNTDTANSLNATATTANNALENAATAQGTADQALSDAASAQSTADSAASSASSARSLARSIANGSYLSGTFINGTTIQSPTIEGNEIKVYGTFQTMGTVSGSIKTTGYMGAAKGMDAGGDDTYGVALSYEWDSDDFSVGNSYVIVTNAGVRLQYNDNNVVVSKGGIYLNAEGSYVDDSGVSRPCKAYYNGTEIGSDTGGDVTVTPVWG